MVVGFVPTMRSARSASPALLMVSDDSVILLLTGYTAVDIRLIDILSWIYDVCDDSVRLVK